MDKSYIHIIFIIDKLIIFLLRKKNKCTIYVVRVLSDSEVLFRPERNTLRLLLVAVCDFSMAPVGPTKV